MDGLGSTLLHRVSRVTLLERSLLKRRADYANYADYADYVARTNAFIPGPPRGA